MSGRSATRVSGTQRSSMLSLLGTVSSGRGASAITVVYVHSTESGDSWTSGGSARGRRSAPAATSAPAAPAAASAPDSSGSSSCLWSGRSRRSISAAWRMSRPGRCQTVPGMREVTTSARTTTSAGRISASSSVSRSAARGASSYESRAPPGNAHVSPEAVHTARCCSNTSGVSGSVGSAARSSSPAAPNRPHRRSPPADTTQPLPSPSLAVTGPPPPRTGPPPYRAGPRVLLDQSARLRAVTSLTWDTLPSRRRLGGRGPGR